MIIAMPLCVAHNILVELEKAGISIKCFHAILSIQWCPIRFVGVFVVKIPLYIDKSTWLQTEECFKTFQ